MQGIDKIADKLVSAIDQNSDYKIHDADKKYVKSKSGTVVTYDELSSITIVKFPDIKNTFKFYNKSGEFLREGNTVKVEYTNNLSQGFIVAKYGATEMLSNSGSLEPITAITIHSDTDYMVSTNSGIEKYIAIFEEE